MNKEIFNKLNKSAKENLVLLFQIKEKKPLPVFDNDINYLLSKGYIEKASDPIKRGKREYCFFNVSADVYEFFIDNSELCNKAIALTDAFKKWDENESFIMPIA